MSDTTVNEYLAQLSARLKALPADRREEELREIRQHLDALVAGHVHRGKTEAEAVQAAIRQFGHAERIGAELGDACARAGETRSWWKSLLVQSLVFVCYFAMVFGFFTSITGPGDLPFIKLENRLLISLTLTSLAFVVNTLAYQARLRSRRA
jgi:hypothetical protein